MSDHAARNLAQIQVLLDDLQGSGYRPTVWCADKGCHAPYAASLTQCPECRTPRAPRAPQGGQQ